VDRDEAAMLLVVLLSGGLLWLFGGLLPSPETTDERVAWRRLWGPAIPAAAPLFLLLGFAIAAPERPQSIGWTRLVAMAPFAFVWIRAGLRAVRGAFARGSAPAATIGLVRPRVELGDELRASLDEGELRAVLAHEEAHARHLDPLRIWLAQVLTDLQWPVSRAQLRQRTWLDALELARDDEAARQPGVEATDLASALVKAARLAGPSVRAHAALTRGDALVATRVRRLLTPETLGAPPAPRSFLLPLSLALALVSFVCGVTTSAGLVALLAGAP